MSTERAHACYTLAELFALKRACPGKHWVVVILILLLAEAGEQVTMSQIAGRMNFSRAAATGVIDAAEELGLVARFHSTGSDRRKIYVRLTVRGLALVRALNFHATAAA
jgi:DNA-binding MarR family transcriptional regulator